MQRSIASFFQPKTGKEKESKKTNGPVKEKPEPVKCPLKVQNGVQSETDSPVKKSSKRSRQILDSDDDDPSAGKEQSVRQDKEDKPVKPKKEQDEELKAVSTPLTPVAAPATPVTSATPVTPATPVTSATPVTPAASGTPETPTSISPSGIPKRRTARKQFPKRKLDSQSGSEKDQEEDEAKERQGQENKRARVDKKQDSTENEEEAMEVGEEEKCLDGLEVEPNKPEKKEKHEEKTHQDEKEKAIDANETATKNSEEDGKKLKDEKGKGKSPKAQMLKEKSPKNEKAKEKSQRSQKKEKERSPKNEKQPIKEEIVTKEERVSESPQAKKAPISSFFAPRKAAMKMEKAEKKSEGDQKEKSEGDKKEKSEGDKKEKSEGDKKEKSEGDKKEKSEGDQSVEQKEGAKVPSTSEDIKDQKGGKADRSQFDPSRPNYHPVDHACWVQGQRVPYLAVARTFEKIEEDSGRLRNIETLSNLFRSVIALSPEDLLCCVYLCLNQLGPAYLGLELGVGETVLMKAVAQATGRQLDKIKAEAAEKGDLGLVAESSRSNQRIMFQPASLTAVGVFNKLKDIGNMSGNSAMNKKIDIIKGLFVACRFSEARYIVRSLAGKLRIGLAEQSVLAALSQAVCLTPPGQEFPPAVIDAGKGMSAEKQKSWIEEKSLILKQTYCEMPSYDVILPVLLKEGIDELPRHCKLTPGIPLRPMLAHPTKGVGEVMKRFDEAAFTCEYKYDGERAQIHILENGEVRIFSRNQEDNTTKYPDIISRIPTVKRESVVSCVLDAEAVAWDREKKQIQPFQVLTTRKRKDVDAADVKVQVCVYAFDLLYLNGESLVKQTLSRRRALLKESFQEKEGEFVFARAIDSNDTDAIAEFLEQSVRDSCEGLMVKTLEKDATYEIAKRSHNWLKLKKDYLDGVGDTMDLCVIGAYLGKGKRTGMYGGFLLACYDEDNEEFQSVCKIGTGFKDEDLEQHYKFLKEHILPKPRPYYRVDPSAGPDVWLDAVQVWEVKCADLSLSPIYKAGMGLCDPEKGISLRFPRFLRIRDDKKPEEATSGGQIADLYQKQQVVQNQGDKADLEDYY
ncbi:DNA ligase 1 [Esox lucius]|uniref:DNA ligase n=1 Tax=Esox lucius TaxID=8010 RepID=A0A3P8ZYX5_ESOLU|nr:DNA ligase 1 [Esox lucius]